MDQESRYIECFGRFGLDFMNPEQIKDEIRKLNWYDRIGLYRWINEEIAGSPGIGVDRSVRIRKEIERYAMLPIERRIFSSAEGANSSSTA
jgi:hypothetical protein